MARGRLDADSFSGNFREYREKAGLTQQQVADAMHYDVSVISRIENGRKGSGTKNFSKIVAAANILGSVITPCWKSRI